MGVLRSFLLDLFLRFLRWEADHPEEAKEAAKARPLLSSIFSANDVML